MIIYGGIDSVDLIRQSSLDCTHKGIEVQYRRTNEQHEQRAANVTDLFSITTITLLQIYLPDNS